MFTKSQIPVILVFLVASKLIPFDRNFLGSVLFFESPNELCAQTQYPYKQYEDRREGIIRSRERVEGETLELVAAAIENNEPVPAGNVTKYNLGFYLQDSARVPIFVRKLEKELYRMEPLRQDYLPGPNTFSWPSAISLHYNISIQDLLPLAKVIGSRHQQVVPVVLYYTRPESAEVRYRFSFIAQRPICELNYEIYRLDSLQRVYSQALNGLIRADKPFQIRWPGQNQNNRTANDGLYKLVVEATFCAPHGQRKRKVTTSCQFYHPSELLKNKWFLIK